jgi:hypothetical protein
VLPLRGLLKLRGDKEAVLFPLDNRREIKPEDAAAAVVIGGEERHILWVTPHR